MNILDAFVKWLQSLNERPHPLSLTKIDATSLDFDPVVPQYAEDVFSIPVLVVCYFPLNQRGWIDKRVTGDVSAPLEAIQAHVTHTTKKVIHALEVGSTFHGYKNPHALASLKYSIVDEIEFHEPLPTSNKFLGSVPMTNYNEIMKRINIQKWVIDKGIKEVWLWGYHGDVVGLWESNMAGPHGDISNSDRDITDLPLLDKTYTVYHYNYQRGPSEAVEDHMHQIEALLRHVDPHLFWDKFVGYPGEGRCGWSHYPPNGEYDYDWANPKYIWTDIENWTPHGTGEKKRMNCTRWRCDSLTWFIYWMQNLPGRDNNLIYLGRSLNNWWSFIGNFDEAIASGRGLYLSE